MQNSKPKGTKMRNFSDTLPTFFFVLICCFVLGGAPQVLAGEDEIAPKWSSDGEYIYYYSYRHPEKELVHKTPAVTMRMRSDGSEEAVLSAGEFRNWWLQPLPCEPGSCASTNLLVTSERDASEPFGGSNIYLFKPDAGTYEALTPTKPKKGEWALHPSLSQDGQYLSYIWRPGFRGGGSRLFLLNRKDGTIEEYTPAGGIEEAAILPDASGFIYSPNESEIHHLDIASRETRLIYKFDDAPKPLMDGLSISADGKRIAFSYGPDGIRSTEVYWIPLDGSSLHQLTNNTVADLRPSWSPDNQTIAFNRVRDPELDWNDILLINRSGEGEMALTNNIPSN